MSNITRNIPFFEINGKRYEIKRNRYLQAEFDKMKNEKQFEDDEEIEYVREQELNDRLEKLSKRKDELYEKYLDTFSTEDEEIYNKACVAYDNLLQQLSETKGVISKKRNEMIDMGEALILKSLQINDEGEIIRTEDEAKEIWNDLIAENGIVFRIEFVVFTINYIMGNDEDNENPFIAQAKAKAEQKANMRKGIVKAK